MDDKNMKLSEGFVSARYLRQAAEAQRQRAGALRSLLAQRALPARGMADADIELLLHELAAMDSNNFASNVGVGEREGRVFSGLVARRHFGLAHGIGRSGELTAEQPKAIGSSLIYKLTNALALDAVHQCGLRAAKSCVVTPVATGMTLTLVLLALKQKNPRGRFVVWPRVDQKSGIKAIVACGLVPIMVETKLVGDEVVCLAEDIEKAVVDRCGGECLAVLTTNSTFTPRAADPIKQVAGMCARLGIAHVVNNAFGLQSTKMTHQVNEAMLTGRVDAVVQSTDKNFMVPVGGAIVVSCGDAVNEVSKLYPGRASIAPVLDLFVTLLSMGKDGLDRLLKERKELFGYFTSHVSEIAAAHGERLLITPSNPVSFAMTLDHFGMTTTTTASEEKKQQFIGSMLFTRNCSGTRVWDKETTEKTIKEVGGVKFEGFGSHMIGFPHSYMTAACAIGTTKDEIDEFCSRLSITLSSCSASLPTTPAPNQTK